MPRLINKDGSPPYEFMVDFSRSVDLLGTPVTCDEGEGEGEG